MNAVEIADAVSDLFQQDFDPVEFPFAFLDAFGNKETTLKRLRKGDSNSSDVPGGVLQRNNIHLAVCELGSVAATLHALKDSPKTASNKVKFILATDGEWLEAEDIVSGEVLSTPYVDLPSHFAFFLSLAGISAVKEIKENPIDIRATGRLNKLYVELLRDNPEWATEARRPDMNHFMARLIFCFFAEDTGIFLSGGLFTNTIDQMTESNGSNTSQVIGRVFEAMNISPAARNKIDLPGWADQFPYVNGGLFSGSTETPRFSRIARSYLLRAGELNWREINPDIFGSMIQAVANDAERGELGMHYTSVPNILKVLNPLFLDDLRAQLERAGDHKQSLLKLRERMARIRVFDPACGSGNFLVIAYKEMRKIEAEINSRRDEIERPSEIPLTNLRGIEIRDFAAEIARLALIIADYQCDVLYRGEKLALAEFLPLNRENWIWKGNALELDWTTVCPPEGTGVKVASDNLFSSPLDQVEIDFKNEGGETYICGNPPYVGKRNRTEDQKREVQAVMGSKIKSSASLDYVFCWLEKAAQYVKRIRAEFAFVTTNSVTQGTQVPIFWPHILAMGLEINFAHRSFMWGNNAAQNAGVTCVIIGVGVPNKQKFIFDADTCYVVSAINPYLLASDVQIVEMHSSSLSGLARMRVGNVPNDGNYLSLTQEEKDSLLRDNPQLQRLIIPLFGAQEMIRGLCRYCIWIEQDELPIALQNKFIAERIQCVRALRLASKDPSYNAIADRSHQYRDRSLASTLTIIVATISSEKREYYPVEVAPGRIGTTNQVYALYDAPLWYVSLIASKLHLVWIATVCGKLKTDFRYSNTLGWNTFPVPILTDSNKKELTKCAEDILLAREAHFPATIADLYAPENMPDDLRRAHERNDEALERIYIGRRLKNDTERLEKLFDMYTKMTAAQPAAKKASTKR